MRERVIAEYHRLLSQDESLSADFFERLRQSMIDGRLLYGERPIGVALRPHFLTRRQYDLLARTSERVASAFEKITAAAVASPVLMERVGLSDIERRFALVDTGLAASGQTTRLDAFVYEDSVKFVEYNAENPSSLPDQQGLNRILFKIKALQHMAARYGLREFDAVNALLKTLLAAYSEWGGVGSPNVAILDWANLPTAHEFTFLRDYFAAAGVAAIVCAPEELEYTAGRLRCGDFKIDLVYKRVVIHEFLARYDETHTLARAYFNHDVCIVNPFRCKVMHKKAAFELLTDEANQAWFSASEREAIHSSVPWTRRVASRRTSYDGREVDLLECLRENRARFVLKPNDDYGGHGIYFGARLKASEWDNCIDAALASDYVVQEAINLRTEEFPIFDEQHWSLQPMYVDTNPFLFRGRVRGAMVRLSDSPIVNVTSGGGETGFFVIEDDEENQISF